MHALAATLERLGERVVQIRVDAREHAELRDAGAHRARADDAQRVGNGLSVRAAHGTMALTPVAALPMISFWICDVPSYSVVTRASLRYRSTG